MKPSIKFTNNEELFKFIIDHHSTMTTHAIAKAIGKKPSWVESQISFLLSEGHIKTRKKSPRKNSLQNLRSIIDLQTPPIEIPQKVESEQKKILVSAERGVPDGWKRQSVVAKKERFEEMELIRWFSRRLSRDVYDEALTEYLEKNRDLLLKARKAKQQNGE